ncbi:protein phosphatase 1, regulatory (inhibitor) subunit 14Bb [Lates japonicus]|uniref:Protein phosphatase 1, regulatory (Inhibitor) subunit 14Bb n=1 Tax=Lates japonicus TaxID=270547 RepID=A0AAD3MFF9_LATJO|nr:protein phosphatase 1, regulatory (inhibitor) subunit 14Bb [Lates japonicus]
MRPRTLFASLRRSFHFHTSGFYPLKPSDHGCCNKPGTSPQPVIFQTPAGCGEPETPVRKQGRVTVKLTTVRS